MAILKEVIDFVQSNITFLTLAAVAVQSTILLFQLVALKRQMKASTYQIVESKYDNLMQLALENEDLRKFFRTGSKDLERKYDESSEEQRRYSLYVEMWYTTYEDIFKMWKQKIITRERWSVGNPGSMIL